MNRHPAKSRKRNAVKTPNRREVGRLRFGTEENACDKTMSVAALSVRMPHPPALTEDPDVIESLYHERGLTLSEIASEYDVSYTAVYNFFDRNDIPTDRTKWRGGRKTEASYLMDNNGYYRWESSFKDETLSCQVHRLLAVAEYGFDAVAGNIVHHKSGVPWDNRPSNLEVMTQSDHATIHNLE